MTHPAGRFHRCTCLSPSPVLGGSRSVRWVPGAEHTSQLLKIDYCGPLPKQAVAARLGRGSTEDTQQGVLFEHFIGASWQIVPFPRSLTSQQR
jgi:hypothetical protein